MLVELKPKTYAATLYMKAGDRVSQTTAGGGENTPSPTELTGKFYSFCYLTDVCAKWCVCVCALTVYS